MLLRCIQCQQDFAPTNAQRVLWYKTKKQRVYCSKDCSRTHQRGPTVELSCTNCQQPFIPNEVQRKQWLNTGRKRAYCSVDCLTAYCATLSSRTMAATNRKYASSRMRERNPMRHSAIRDRVSKTMKDRGCCPTIRGGNGKPLPVPQRTLWLALGAEWLTEFVVPTRIPMGNGYPTCYKIDIAHPMLRLGIEVDGNSHKPIKRQQQDQKKEEVLHGKGWTILRFSNQAVMERLEECVQTVLCTTSKLKGCTPTSPMAL